MKYSKFVLAIILLSSFTFTCAEKKELIYKEEASGFQISVPADWTIKEFPGLKYKIIHKDPDDGFAPNLNFVDEKFDGDLRQYVKINKENLERILQDYNLLEESDYKDETKKGIKLVVTNTQNQMKLKQIFYFFENGEIKFTLTCSVLQKHGNKYDKEFEKLIKNFKITK